MREDLQELFRCPKCKQDTIKVWVVREQGYVEDAYVDEVTCGCSLYPEQRSYAASRARSVLNSRA